MAKISLQDYLESHEFLKSTFEMQSRVEKIVADLVEPIDFPSLDDCKALTMDGLPLIQHDDLFDKIVDTVTFSLPTAIKILADNGMIDADEVPIDPIDYDLIRSLSQSLIRQQNDVIDCTPIIRLIVWQIVSRSIPNEIKSDTFWQSTKWRRNYCPICGRRPVMAQLKKEMNGRARFLLCDGCRTMWPYHRLSCVYCGNDELSRMHILEIESEPDVRLDVCDECHAYLKTYNHEGDEEIFLNDRLTLHLDLLAEDEQLQKIGSVLIE